MIAAALYVEARVAADPVIPLRLFRDRTTALATAASALVGVAMFGATVYLSQYFQLARGMSPTEAGLMSIAMVGGLLVSSIATGRIITATGLWKRWLVGGMVLVVVGLAPARQHRRRHPPRRGPRLHGRRSASASAPPCRTSSWPSRTTPRSPTWARPARSSRSSGRWAAPPASRRWARCWPTRCPARSATAWPRWASTRRATRATRSPTSTQLPAPIRDLYEHAFGDAIGHIFLVSVPFALLALICVLAIREVPLRTTVTKEGESAMTTSRHDPRASSRRSAC